jgi:hypothetical protein
MEVVTPSNDSLSDYFTVGEVASRIRCSPDTIRRHLSDPKSPIAREIEWADLMGNGKLRATKESVERYLENCHRKMKKSLEGIKRGGRA